MISLTGFRGLKPPAPSERQMLEYFNINIGFFPSNLSLKSGQHYWMRLRGIECDEQPW
jgi:hypothetical protein